MQRKDVILSVEEVCCTKASIAKLSCSLILDKICVLEASGGRMDMNTEYDRRSHMSYQRTLVPVY